MKYSVVMPVKIDHEWQRVMTECAIETLGCTADLDFELIVVECETEHFSPKTWTEYNMPPFLYDHIQIKEPMGANAELNVGIEAARGEYVIYTQSDIFVRPGWLEALQQCFDECSDCGLATLASSDLRGKLSTPMPSDQIIEGVYGPFMMWKREHGWLIDAETFPANFGDTDLIMRVYELGFRMYRNFRVVIDHINQATTRGPEHDKDFADARNRFIAKHRGSSLLMYQILAGGQIL